MSESTVPDSNCRGLIEKVAEIYRDPERIEMLGQHSTVSYRVTSYLANAEGWLYHCGGQEVSAESTRRHLVTLCGETVGGFGLHAAALAFGWTRDSGAFTEEELQFVEDGLVRSAVKASSAMLDGSSHPLIYNHATLAAMGCEMVANLFPDRDEAESLTEYVTRTWQDCRAVRENVETTSLYEPFNTASVIRIAEMRGLDDEYFEDPIIRNAFERFLQNVTPLGPVGNYGDGYWASMWGWWVALFERAAARYQDGRFKWAAQHVLEYACKHRFWENALDSMKLTELPLTLRHFLDGEVLIETHGLVLADMWADPGVKAQIPKGGATFTHRRQMTQLKPFRMGPRVQDKLILRNGWQEDCSFMMVGLAPLTTWLWHDQHDAGAILQLCHQGALLLQETGYFWPDPRYHNAVLVRPIDEEDFLGPQKEVYRYNAATTDLLSDQARVSFARVRCPRHQETEVDHTRTIVFGKKIPLIAVWDTVRVIDGDHRIAPLFHVQEIAAEGERYFDTVRRYVTGGLGARWSNEPLHLLISFPLDTGEIARGTPEMPEGFWDGYSEPRWVSHYNAKRVQYECLHQVTTARAGETRSFLTLLIPHAAEQDATDLAGSIRVLFQDDHSCCVRVGSVTMVFNDKPAEGAKLSVGTVETDASLVWLEEDGEGRYAAYCETSELTIEGEVAIADTRPSDGEVWLSALPPQEGEETSR